MLIEKYKLIVFDLDGTLVSTSPSYRYSLIPRVLRKLGIIDLSHIDTLTIDKFWFDIDRDITVSDNFKYPPKDFRRVFKRLDGIAERAKYVYLYEDIEVLFKLKNFRIH